MLKNYLKIAFRNLRKKKGYTIINVLGLALSITCAVLIYSLVTYHLSFNAGHPDAKRIYRIVTEQHRDNVSYTAGVPSPLGKAFRNDYNYGEKVARIAVFDEMLINFNEGGRQEKYKEEAGVAFTEPAYFDIFNFPLLSGNKETVLTEPNTAIITQALAEKYFGKENPVNKTIRMDNKIDLRITGVLKNIPENSDLQCGIYASYITLKQYNEWLASDIEAWGGIESSMNCFILLRNNVQPKTVENVLDLYVKKFRPKSKNIHHYKLQPLADVHFDSRYGGTMEKKNLWILSFIALFLVATACINFINLATAQAMNRAKEIGVRKVLGGKRRQLFWQFIAETSMIAFVAILLAVVLSYLLLPLMNDWFASHISIHFSDVKLLSFVVLLGVLVTFFAGAYPGLVLSGMQPIQALKSKATQKYGTGINTRRGLIVGQFAISQVLLIAVIVIAQQMNYSKESDLGFNKDAVVLVPSPADGSKAKTLKHELQQIAGVTNVTDCNAPPSSNSTWNSSPRYDNRQEDEAFRVSIKSADADYVKTFGLEIIAGRDLFPSDTVKEFLVNETFAKKLNLASPGDVIGKMLGVNDDRGPIVGVVKDFHDKSFFSDINAVCIGTAASNYYTYAIKIQPGKIRGTLAAIEKKWSVMNPESVYEYEFLDDHIAKFYETEDLVLRLIKAFTFIAIFIGCLGLYGLVSFMAAQRRKEIGIRRVLGGSMADIMWIFGKEFSKLIVIAFLIAAPAGWWFMNNWLQDFKYRIDISAWMFVLVIVGTGTICLLTVGYQAIKAAIANPVKSLRSE